MGDCKNKECEDQGKYEGGCIRNLNRDSCIFHGDNPNMRAERYKKENVRLKQDLAIHKKMSGFDGKIISDLRNKVLEKKTVIKLIYENLSFTEYCSEIPTIEHITKQAQEEIESAKRRRKREFNRTSPRRG